MKILITGGVKSGKSSFALELAGKYFPGPKTFLATAIAFDEELKQRIAIHRSQRDPDYTTVEEPLEIHRQVRENLVLDCITLWMNNIFHFKAEERWEEILRAFIRDLKQNAIIVTNEVGLGNIPADRISRKYNDELGKANRLIASYMDHVYLIVSGIPLLLK